MFLAPRACNDPLRRNGGGVSSPELSLADVDGSPCSVPDDAEDLTFRNRMTIKGFFKSRNTLRAEELERKKKQKQVSTNKDNEVIDLTSTTLHNDTRRAEATIQHSKAVTLQAVSGIYQSQLDSLQKAKSMGVTAEELCPFILRTLANLYSSSDEALKKLGHNNTMTNTDPEVAFVEIRKMLVGTEGNTDCVDKKRPANNDGLMYCAAGECCVEIPRTVIDSGPVCPVCEKIAHAVCIAVYDDKEGCMACIVDEEL